MSNSKLTVYVGAFFRDIGLKGTSNSLHSFQADFLLLYLSPTNVFIYPISQLSALSLQSLDSSFSAFQSPGCAFQREHGKLKTEESEM